MPLGVFDSGIGGLTVVRALRAAFPARDILYVGDTARVPYGNKSAETVLTYSREIVDFLEKKGAERIVVACNTASALAVPFLAKAANVPIHGMIASGVTAALEAGEGPVGGDWDFSHDRQRGLSTSLGQGAAWTQGGGGGHAAFGPFGGGGMVGGRSD